MCTTDDCPWRKLFYCRVSSFLLLLLFLHARVGWPSVDAYYAGSSSAKRIPNVAIPLLCIQALDDPIAPKEAIPYEALKANPNCVLVTTPCGGHLGWASGPGAPFGSPWTDAAVMEWLGAAHEELGKRGRGGRGKGAVRGVVGVGADSRVEMEVSAAAVAGESAAWARSVVEASAAGAAAAVRGGEEDEQSLVGSSGAREEDEGAAVVAGVQRGRGVVGFISVAEDAGVATAAASIASSSGGKGQSSYRAAAAAGGDGGGVLGLEDALRDPQLEAELAAAVEASVQAAVKAVLMAKLKQQQQREQIMEASGPSPSTAAGGDEVFGVEQQQQQGQQGEGLPLVAEVQEQQLEAGADKDGSLMSKQESGELKAAVFGAHLRWAL